jgi:Uma2 family endonuclease
MVMPDLARTWTRDDVLALPDDGNRYELVDGELLVSPSPRGLHQRAVLSLFRRVDPYVLANRLGAVSLAPADLDLRSGQLVQPDLFVGELIDGREPIEWSDFRIPILVAEVLSPSTAQYDRVTKRRRYQRSGIPAYWIIDPDARVVEVWSPRATKPVIVDATLSWVPPGPDATLTIDLPGYFREVWAE